MYMKENLPSLFMFMALLWRIKACTILDLFLYKVSKSPRAEIKSVYKSYYKKSISIVLNYELKIMNFIFAKPCSCSVDSYCFDVYGVSHRSALANFRIYLIKKNNDNE